MVLSGTPGSGKTGEALEITKMLISDAQMTVAWFSLAESCEMLAYRLLTMEDGAAMYPPVAPGEEIPWSKCERAGWRRMDDHSVLREAEILINDTPGISVHEFAELCREYKEEYGVTAAVIDYLQLMDRGSASGADILDEVKKAAEDLNIGILLLQETPSLGRKSL